MIGCAAGDARHITEVAGLRPVPIITNISSDLTFFDLQIRNENATL
jgi:hypothetical protein